MNDKLHRLVRRLSDGKVLPVVDEQGDEICVEELFDFADGGPSPRPLKLWHPKTRYVPANTEGGRAMEKSDNASGAQVPCISLLADLHSRLWARCENAYCDMIAVARREESLGWEIKVERGEFGRKELDSHAKMGELLGRHRALAEVCREIDDVLKANKAICLNETKGGE